MEKARLRALAKAIVQEGIVEKSAWKFIVSNLSKTDLKMFLVFLKKELQNSQVFVETTDKINSETVKDIEKLFGKKLVVSENPNLGAGMIIKNADDIIDMSFKNYIEQTVKGIKSNLS